MTAYFRRLFRRTWYRVRCLCKSCFSTIKIVYNSLCYNEFVDKYYIGDTLMEPLFWFIDHFAKALGPIFVVAVTILLTSICAIAYIIGIPYWSEHNCFVLIVALVIGHWLLINVIFHYWMALTTCPGTPPEGALIPEAVSVCKKCVAPKPPRTHHCSVCNRCILKMDHHCPWLNNCVGHFTHRYFFMFCCYVLLGDLFIMLFGVSVAYDEYFGYLDEAPSVAKIGNFSHSSSVSNSTSVTTAPGSSSVRRYCITYAMLVCIGVFLALGSLTVWHAHLITNGETSIEAHINKKERIRLKKLGKIYRNPYNFGPRMNWKLFLGLTNGRTWKHLLLPSAHHPEGDGLTWNTIYGPRD